VPKAIRRKQRATHEEFLAVLEEIESVVPRAVYVARRDSTAAWLRRRLKGQRAAFAWSGGKDSIALQAVAERAGITDCVFGMTKGLEYPAWLQWVTDHMPHGLTVLRNDWDMAWLADRQDMLFPRDSTVAGKWFSGIQHRAQRLYFRDRELDVLLLGRRWADGNYTGPGQRQMVYTDARGITRMSPIAAWSHELVLAALQYDWLDLGRELPPFYRWPRGFRCGTHAWPARQWCDSIEHGWDEVWQIDSTIVATAAKHGILGAAECVARHGGKP